MADANRVGTLAQKRGAAAEDEALAWLEARGLRLLARNFRCRGGEIDLVMQHRDELVFVEVRARTSASHGTAAASVTPRKQARMVLAAQVWLQRHRQPPRCRFDVVALDGPRLEWLPAAFSL